MRALGHDEARSGQRNGGETRRSEALHTGTEAEKRQVCSELGCFVCARRMLQLVLQRQRGQRDSSVPWRHGRSQICHPMRAL